MSTSEASCISTATAMVSGTTANGVAGIVVALGAQDRDRRRGRRFDGMMPGVYNVGLDLRHLSTDYTNHV